MNLKVTNILSTGAKTLFFKHETLRFRYSLSFLNMLLDSFTNTFNLKELKKGWFPHKFSRPQNFDYKGAIPNIDYCEPNTMKTKKKKEFEKWYAEQLEKDDIWNLKEELLRYYESDVQLMKEGCMKFVEEFRKTAKFDPMIQCTTIASACHYFW